MLADRYRVARVVSWGASTVLIDAIDQSNERQVNLKIVRPELALQDEFRTKFNRLAEISNALTHPNIASVSDWGEIDFQGEPTVYWTVDALGGGSMRDLLDRGRLLEPGQALVVGLEACRALDAAHQKGLFHTEITPSKMVFGADRRLRVVDFGMARLLAEGAWADAATVPTDVARYASPEQALGLPVDAKTDVYALALVMIEAVTGGVPFFADSTVATLASRVDKLMPVSADLGALASVLERAGRPESADRFTAAEFGRALVEIAPKLPKPAPIPIVSTGMFDSTAASAALRRPTDPTGGIERPAPVTELERVGVDAAIAETELPETELPETEAPEIGPADAVIETEAELEAELATGIEDRREDDPAVDDLRIIGDVEVATEPEVDIEPDTDIDSDIEPDIEPEPTPTEAMPVNEVLAAQGAGVETTDIARVEAVPQSAADAALYDEEAEQRKRRKGPIVLLVVILLAGLAGLGYAYTLLTAPKSFEVPELAGVPEAQAMNQIAGNDWQITTVEERSDTFPEPDTVIRTEPAAGVELEENEPFTLVLSAGPEFRTLPEVNELSFEAAVTTLSDLGLRASEVPERVFSEDVPLGSVVSWRVDGDADSTMQAGSEILPGETILLTLSAGPEPRSVPEVVGATVADATASLDELRLVLAEGDALFSDTAPVGQIVAQSPEPGTELERDGTVTVQVSLGPDVIEFPELEGLSFDDAQALLAETGFQIGTLLGTTNGNFVQATIDGVDVVPGTEFERGQVIDFIFL